MVHGTMVPAAKTARERRGRVRNIKEYDATFDTTRGPEHRKTCSWVQNVEDHVSAIDFGSTSAQGSKTLKIMFLESILAILPPRGPTQANRASGIDF